MRFNFGFFGWYLAWAVGVAVLFAAPANAWGPGAHVETGLYIFRHLALLTPFIARILRAHPSAFIYGSVSPDMVLGKRYMKPERNNHRWETGFSILRDAETDRQQAFALGYLSHLAADTVAHNHYVPDRLLDEFGRRRRSHIMHELVFDSTIEEEVWALARLSASRPFPECDRILFKNLSGTPLPVSVNHRLFHSGMQLVRMGGWQRVIRLLRNRWEGQVDEAAMMEYRSRMHRAVLDFLQDPIGADCLRQSPTGGEILPQAENIKVMLKHLSRSGLDPVAYQDIISAFRRWREEALNGSPHPAD